ncbi:PstS family phosphate ABC transporter substrate-binding protein [Clostridium cylindrosporum]|uniref:Phosphate-binding protein n=1 Tax=Clostridium cylindrosporum DSM 605 TaxID=1121307 RepID=A0A0J8DE01_CLOCY|nr:PstS family phosphate ABC transporter substrate-binding protein [Clostridium cylindrosporum]KMT22443.1 phosphate binding protein [Clostridium cylindrosporum DSM 605]
MKKLRGLVAIAVIAVTSLTAVGCGKGDTSSGLTGKIKIDGSSTVAPISQVVSEYFNEEHRDVRVSVGTSGTGGGFKKFYANEIDINDASRAIKEEEAEKAKKNGVEMQEFEIAYDGIAVVVNPGNNWVNDVSTEDLKKIWEPNSKVKMWSDINPAWPKKEIKLYGPGTDSGTFDYFTEAINGKSKSIRTDFTASEDDNVLVQGIANDKYALGYFGAAFYEENSSKLKALKVNGVELNAKSISDKTYSPLSRPLYIYVNKKSFERPEVHKYLTYYMTRVKEFVTEVGYYPLEDKKYEEALKKVNELAGK